MSLGYDSVPTAASPALVAAAGAPLADTDLRLALPGRVQYRAMRGFGVVCAAPTVAGLVLRRSLYAGLRDPAAGDGLALFVEGDRTTGSDDAWVHATVTAVATGGCDDGSPGLAVALGWPTPALGTAAIALTTVGGPVRVFETMELQYYVSGGQSWLGMRSVSAGGTIQPLVGPLADSTAGVRGLTFAYLDGNDVPTGALERVRSMTLTLRGVTEQRVYRSGGQTSAIDTVSMSARVALRNALRP